MKKLSKETEKWQTDVLKQFSITDAGGLKILQVAAEALETINACQVIIDRDGLVVVGDRGGTKSHPLLATIRDSRSQFLQSMRLLNLE